MESTQEQIQRSVDKLHNVEFLRNNITETTLNQIFDLIESGETVGLAINICHGDFEPNDTCIRLYVKKCNIEYDSYAFLEIDRTDPRLIDSIRELKKQGLTVSVDGSKIQVKQIPKFLLYFYSLIDYDGQEKINLNFEKFKVYIISAIVHSQYSESERLSKIAMICDLI
jgi:hypothetical protein